MLRLANKNIGAPGSPTRGGLAANLQTAVAGFRCEAACGMALAALLAPGLADPARAAEPAATPYRPSVSSPADLSAPGHRLEAVGRKPAATVPLRFSWLLKHAFTEDFGILLGGEAAVLQREATGSVGAVTAIAAWRSSSAAPGGTSALGLEVGVKGHRGGRTRFR